jgi:hypothetical protein
MNRACSMHERDEALNILVGKTQGKRRLGRRMRNWNNIKMNFKETWWEDVDRIHVAQNTDRWWASVNTVMNVFVPQKTVEHLE